MKDPACPPDINPIVWEMRKIAIDGNIVPHKSFSDIVTVSESGKIRPHLLAITIMAEIIYWYRPSIVVDERTGIVTYHQKFYADKLQKSYIDLAKKFGVEKRQVKEACDLLRRLGLISIEFRTIEVSGSKLSNVIFIEPNFESVLRMLFQDEGVVRNSAGGGTALRITPHKKQRGYPAKKRKTYTHITRETTPQSTTTTAVEVVVDDAEYTTDIIGLLDLQSQGQARSCADKIRLDHPTWPSGQIYHAIWVLAHQVANGYIVRTSWARTVEKMIINGIEHRADIPSPAQVRLERMSKERLIWGKKAAQHREKSEIARTEAVFRTLPEPEKEEYRERFRRKLGLVGTTTAIEIGAIGEYISSLQGGR